jgi:hypothetical protein
MSPGGIIKGEGQISQTYWPTSNITPKKAATAVGRRRNARLNGVSTKA